MKIILPENCYGQRIDKALSIVLPQYSRTQLTQWLKSGLITSKTGILKPKDHVTPGMEFEINLEEISTVLPEYKAEPENIPLAIVYEDEHLLIVNKQANIVVHPGAGNSEHTLVNALLYYHPELKNLNRAGIIHRLDKDTTGLLLVAKTQTAYTALNRLMQEREIQRTYLALVHGNVISGNTIKTFYARSPHNRLKMSVATSGKEAITSYLVKTKYQNFTLLEVSLLTGRTHQIRVHMAHIRHPVVGDPLYGLKRNHIPKSVNEILRTELLQFKRQALHAYKLSFLHPITKLPLTAHADLPNDFNTLLTLLDNNAIS